MLSRDIPLFKLDLSGKNPDNYIGPEYYRRTDAENDIVFILRSGPFYTASLQLTDTEGNDLVEDEDYEIFGIASALTAFAKDKEVGMMIKIINPKLTEWFASYQVMGHFSTLNQDLVNLIEGAINDDRPLYYKNIKKKPLWFDPKLHQHDIRYDIHSFGDLIDIIQRIPDIKRQRKNPITFGVEQFYDTITSHIEAYETMLLNYIKKHDSDNVSPLTNSHGLTASQVGLGDVDNFSTATLLDALDGFRQDLHLTADVVSQVIAQQPDANKTLYPSGILPILRYGNSSFIPSPIQGSYEGMGGTDFRVGYNIEPNGETLLLGNRNDGRVDALYFMRNKKFGTGGVDDAWEYTAYVYEHQTAKNDGVKLSKILRGSDGRFLIIGGYDKNNTLTWYYTLGNGSFDPLKHVLVRVPSNVNITTESLLFNEGFPDRVLLFTREANGESIIKGEYRNVAYQTPTDANSFSGVSLSNSTIGYWGYEYNIKEGTWRRIMFHYTQCGYSEQVTCRIWIPYKTVIETASVERPRGDGRTDLPYGIGAQQYVFSTLLTFWNNRAWFETCLGFYKENNDAFYLKFINSAYGVDQRAGTHEGGTYSMNVVMGQRTLGEGDLVHYTLENRRGIDKQYRYNNAVFNSDGRTNTTYNVTDMESNPVSAPYGEPTPAGYSGIMTIVLLNGVHYTSIGSRSYGTFPVQFGYVNLTGHNVVNDPDIWLNNRIDSDKSVAYNRKEIIYNETNPAGLSIGMHSVFWQQLDPNDPASMGSITYGYNGQRSGMVYRKQPTVLNAQGYPTPPTKAFTLYVDKNITGYDLNNTTYNIFNNAFMNEKTPWCTNIFYPSTDNRKSDYVKHFAGHHSVPVSGALHNTTANTRFQIEWETRQAEGVIYDKTPNEKVVSGYSFFPTKTIEMKEVINNVLIPKIIEGAKSTDPNEPFTFVNALAWHRIGFTHLRSTRYENLLIFSTIGFSESRNNAKTFSVAFNLTGGTPDSDGVIQGAQAQIVGNVVSTDYTVPTNLSMTEGRKENSNIRLGNGTTHTMPRDLVRQLENGKSHVNMQWLPYVDVTGNLSRPGVTYIVSESGIEGASFQYAYWTAGEYHFFHHPYYGLVNRQMPTGPAQIGRPYTFNPNTVAEALTINSTTGLILGEANYMEGAFTIIFATAQKGIQNGNRFSLPIGQRDLNEITSNPRNKTFYIYLDYNENGAYYNISLTPQAETATRGLLSIVKTNNESIYEIVNYNVFTMDGIRISIQKKGSVIPAATGSITDSGQLEGWVTKNRS